MPRVLMVCTGNICRSFMAEVVLADAARRAGRPDIEVDSVGVSDEEEGNGPDRRAVRVLREAGYAVPPHRARQISRGDLTQSDLVLAMTDGHYRALRRLAERLGLSDAQAPRIAMYRDWDPQGSGNVPDPWYGDMDDFVDTLDCVERVTPALLAALGGDVS
ncbi:MAG: low molecular weight protein-tyrosine-phosphatase [Actinomycetaceae bacterium]|nr:low molecular weight protein-tyrosine-phosphatase [Actinomycetaceae bacterium]MDU0970739.1 low molecular weight protein-tyrosine-phosphatase [Actinomycetaceae bacterium]